MTCCNINIIPFAAVATSTVPYVGNKPTVSVMYLQADGTFLVAGVFTQVNIAGGLVQVDHGGGFQSGFIKILQ